jgi:exoribonuclease-2
MEHTVDLVRIARNVMLEKGLLPDFPPKVLKQIGALRGPAVTSDPSVRDLRKRLWCSIDNDDSRDLDQLSVAEDLGSGRIRQYVAIADVDEIVSQGSPVDLHAQHNTTSVYTAGGIFPMLPERLSTDLTSLNPGEDRLAVVMSYVVDDAGAVSGGEVFRALVHNHAQLAYPSISAWLEGEADLPEAAAAVPGLEKQLRLQDRVAQNLLDRREEEGALSLQTIEAKATVEDGRVLEIHADTKGRAHELIENLMIAANGVATRYLSARRFPTFRRVVREPERWNRLCALALEYGEVLPPDPDPKPLEHFLRSMKQRDPDRFPDLSLTVIKLMGAGEYVVNLPNRPPIGHFGLAVRDYSHSTAPNRRYPDIITQRLLKAALAGDPVPYSNKELMALAEHCTLQEDAAKKVERHLRKSAAAALLMDRIGDRFTGFVTGVTNAGTWVRVVQPPVEGRLEAAGLDVGDKVTVRLASVDVERGFIDFVTAG